MDFTIWSDRCEPDILKYFTVNGDRKTIVLKVGRQLGIAFAEYAQ